MLYLLNVEEKNNNKSIYKMFETHTESIMTGNINYVRKLVHLCKMRPVNMIITSKEIMINQWPHNLKTLQLSRTYDLNTLTGLKYTYILLAKINEQRFKLINLTGEVIYTGADELINSIESNEVLNCSIDNGTYKSIDTYEIKVDTKFQKYIDRKYAEFRAKTLMFGINISFKYEIENKEVKIIDYEGENKRIIIPNFITTICKDAFRNQEIQEVKLNVGLKYIGETAFANNRIDHVEIPETVLFVGDKAFERDPSGLSIKGNHNQTINKLNNSTILL